MITSLTKTTLVAIPILLGAVALSAAPVKHPNLLLNPDELARVKTKIATNPWAAAALRNYRG